jgi:hypothetical protein
MARRKEERRQVRFTSSFELTIREAHYRMASASRC